MPFGSDQPLGIGTIALGHTVRVVPDKKVRYPPGRAIGVKA